MSWTDVTMAGAFIAGAVTGAAGTIRITRLIFDYYGRTD